MATDNTVREVKENIATILNFKIDSIISRVRGSEKNNPYDTASSCTEIKYICETLLTLPLKDIPEGNMSRLNIILNRISSHYMAFLNPADIKNIKREPYNFPQEIEIDYEELFSLASMYFPYFSLKDNTYELRKNKLNEIVYQAGIQKSHLDNVIADAEIKAGEIGVKLYARGFAKEFADLEKAASRWLCATIIFAIFTIITTLYFVFIFKVEIYSTVTAIIHISSKLFLMGLLITVTLWCGNMYKAMKHQVAVNKFKANSLNTFKTFINATQNTDIQDAVLLETTRAIFNESSTGLIGQDDANKYKPINIVELMKKSSE